MKRIIDSPRYIANSLSNLIDNLFEGIHIIKSKYEHGEKTCETFRIKYKYCYFFLEYSNFKVDLIEYYRNKNSETKFEKKVKRTIL